MFEIKRLFESRDPPLCVLQFFFLGLELLNQFEKSFPPGKLRSS